MSNTPWRRNDVKLEVNASVAHTESATVPGGAPGAAIGKFWVRSDTPNVPMFTNNAGTDYVLLAGPSSATNERIAVFDGTTGKLIKDGGSLITDLVATSGVRDITGTQTFTSGITMNSASPNLTMGNAGGTPVLILNKDETAQARIDLKNEGVLRWRIAMTGGEDFEIERYDSAGALVDIPFVLSQALGNVTLLCGASSTGNAGSFTVTAGASTSATDGDGGDLTFTAGASTDGDGGSFLFTGGASASADASDPAGGFVFTGGNQTSTAAVSGSGGGGFTFTGGTSAHPDTGSTGGSFTVTAGAHSANSANARGGSVTIEGGDVSSTTAGAIAGSVTIRGGANTGAAANTAGAVIIEGGSPDGNAANIGGAVTIEAGGSNTGSATDCIGGALTLEAGDGVGTGRAGGDLTLSSGDGNSAGSINILAGDGLSNGSGGTITIEAGLGNGSGGQGDINFDTHGGSSNSGGTIAMDTQVGSYVGSEWKYRTIGAVLAGASGNTTVFTIPGPSLNGRNLKTRVWGTIQHVTTTTNTRSHLYEAAYRRSGGATLLIGAAAHTDSNLVTGTCAANFTLTVNGSNVDIVCAAETAAGIDTRWMFEIEWQQGGFTA